MGEISEVYQEISKEIKNIKTELDMRKAQSMNAILPPPLEFKNNQSSLHQKAINGYLRRGEEADLRDIGLEAKSLSTVIQSDGGFLVDPETSTLIQSALHQAPSLRNVANVVQVEASAYDVLVDHGAFDAGWVNETDARSESTTGKFDRISIPLFELSAMPKSSQRLLDDAAFDVETWLASRIADSFARAESAAYVNGDGSDKPRGFLDHQIVDDQDWEWGKLGCFKTGADGDFAEGAAADAILDLVYGLGAEYRRNAVFVMNSKTAGTLRKLKDSDGRFLWADSLAAGEPARLLGYRVLICEDMPDIASGAHAIAFGDFGTGYTIAERPDLRVMRDPFSAKPHVLFYATKRVGGDVTDFAAIKLLEFSANSTSL